MTRPTCRSGVTVVSGGPRHVAWAGALGGPGRAHTNPIVVVGARVIGVVGTITVMAVVGGMVPAGPGPAGGRTPAGPAGTLDDGTVAGDAVVVVVLVNGGRGRNVGLAGAGLGVGPVRTWTATTRPPTAAYHVVASRYVMRVRAALPILLIVVIGVRPSITRFDQGIAGEQARAGGQHRDGWFAALELQNHLAEDEGRAEGERHDIPKATQVAHSR